MNRSPVQAVSKVPEVTLIFWIIKIAATTLGETGGDALSMSMKLGYLVGTAIFAATFLVGTDRTHDCLHLDFPATRGKKLGPWK